MPLLAFFLSFLLGAQSAAPVANQTTIQPRVLVAAVRTQNHVSLSSAEKFEEAAEGVEEFLREQKVVTAEDPVRRKVRLEGQIPRPALLNIAQDAGASHVLEITVDRPVTSWVDLTARCLDGQGYVLWEEQAGTALGLSSMGHIEKAVKKLGDKLVLRRGGACLPLAIAVPEAARAETRVLREGTLLKLKFAQTVSTRTAHLGDIVEFAVADDVVVDGATVIRKGARAVGHIAEAEGDKGLQLALDGVRCHGRTVKIRGVESKVEDRKVAGVALPFGISGFLLGGKEAQMTEGMAVHAVIAADEELPVLP